MRRKKHKASRRIVRFYKLHFEFREPFKVQQLMSLSERSRNQILAHTPKLAWLTGAHGRKFSSCGFSDEVRLFPCAGCHSSAQRLAVSTLWQHLLTEGNDMQTQQSRRTNKQSAWLQSPALCAKLCYEGAP